MNIISQTHQWIFNKLHQNSHIIDMTCGNGHDTKFLATHALKVTAIDIQKQAIENTKKRCKDFDNINYILANHASLDYENYGPIHGVIYNLGYLPHGDKSIITQTESTLESLNLIKDLVKDFIVITVYPGHAGGDTEAMAVLNWIRDHNYDPSIFKYESKRSPIAYCIAI